MKFFSRSIRLIYFSATLGALITLCITNVNAIPLDDAFETDQAKYRSIPEFHPRNEMPSVFHPSLHPNLNNEVNELHPIPDYIKKFSKNQAFPIFYQRLLNVEPQNQVQSKVFNTRAFRSTRRIGIFSFENKTSGPFRDASAGNILAKQVVQELQSVNKYFIFPPPPVSRDAQLTIVKKIPFGKEKPRSSNTGPQPGIHNLPKTNDKMDAVMIGAVTKYMDSYRTKNGNIENSVSSSIEFGLFLVSTLTGDVIWGARFIGSQPTGISSFLLGSSPTWLSKEQLSQVAMKNVLKAFHENRLE